MFYVDCIDNSIEKNYKNTVAIKFYFKIQNQNSNPTVTNLLPHHNTRQECITRSISHLFLYQLTKAIMVRDNFFTLNFRTKSHTTLEQ